MWPLYFILKHPHILPLLAVAGEAVTTVVADRWSPIINLGAIGCVLLWFLLRAEPRMRAIEDAIDRSSRAVLLLVVTMQGIPTYAKEEAKAIIKEIDVKKT